VGRLGDGDLRAAPKVTSPLVVARGEVVSSALGDDSRVRWKFSEAIVLELWRSPMLSVTNRLAVSDPLFGLEGLKRLDFQDRF
jgi:hypothetical protein